MATYLVDTSVVSQYFLSETYTPQVRALIAGMMDCSLITVDRRQADAAAASGATLKPITDFSPEN